MSGRRAKADRKIVSDIKRQALDELRHPVNTIATNTDDLHNRLTDVEAWARAVSNVLCVPGVRGIPKRLRWLLTGR